MKNLNLTLVAIAIGLTVSASAIGQNNSLQGATYNQIASEYAALYPNSFESIDDADAVAIEQPVESNSPAAAAANRAAADKLDALYETSKLQCANYTAGARANCLNQMKAGFGR